VGVGEETDKAGLRARLRTARTRLAAPALAEAAAAMRLHVVAELAGSRRIAAYVPVGSEPGSLELLDALAAGGMEVLLPVVVPGGLDWSAYAGRDRLVTGPLGVREPDGARLGAAALADADTVLVPALAVDRSGTRLGRGGGYYDRALVVIPPGTPVAALLHDGELVRELPSDPWDRPVTAAVTPATGWTELPIQEHHGR
jgi:5-formyltetrahydrofolate cyclo-ligase